MKKYMASSSLDIPMSEITKERAFVFANAMAEERPPVNTHLIQKHIDYWNENYDDEISDPIIEWYEFWIKRVENEEYCVESYNSAYNEYLKVLKEFVRS